MRHNDSCCDFYNIQVGGGGGVWNTIRAWRDKMSLFYFDQILNVLLSDIEVLAFDVSTSTNCLLVKRRLVSYD